jgi:hypothetical protein
VRFDSLFGSSANQVPLNATVLSAKLILNTPKNVTGTDYGSVDIFRAHRMLIDWTESATWNSLGGGVATDNIEAATTASFSAVPYVDGGPCIFDVTSDVELFKAGTANRGWLLRPSTTGTGDGWTMKSSKYAADATLRPALEIVYALPAGPSPYSLWATSKGLTPANNSPYADPDNDGVNNAAEFAYNLNPLVADAAPLPIGGSAGLPAPRYAANVSGGVLYVEFVRRKGTNAVGLTYTVQFSGNPIDSWVNGATPTVTSLNADWDRVTVRDSVNGPNASRFAKVTVALTGN